MEYDYLVDASGEVCPMPLLKAKQQLNKMQPGQRLKVIASDEGSVRDFAAFISLTAHELSQIPVSDPDQSQFVYYITKR